MGWTSCVASCPARRPGSARSGLLYVEMHESHAPALPALCLAAGFAAAEVGRDLAGLPRWVVARLPGPA